MTNAAETCPFALLCERDVAGEALDAGDLERLEAHLEGGCPVCGGVVSAALEPAGPGGDARTEARRDVESRIDRAVDAAATRMAKGEAAVLSRVAEALRHDDLLAGRRARRRVLRGLFWVTYSVSAVLLVMAYVGTVVFARLQRRAAARLATATELQALMRALARRVTDSGHIPTDMAALVTELSGPRPDGTPRYYPFDPARRRPDGAYVDDFGHPYRYRATQDEALVYSTGPDGEDDGADAEHDIVPLPLIFVR